MNKKNNSNDKYLQGITQISKAIMDRNYLDDLLALIVSVTAKITDSRICSILLLDKQKNELILKACQSDLGKYSQRSNTPLGKGIAGRVAQSNNPIKVINVCKDPRFINKKIAEEDGLVSLVSVPMSVEGEIIGVINCYTPHEYDFSKQEIDMLTTIATQAAVVIKNTELRVMKEIVELELQERKIIEQAKEILMQKKNISGKEAFNLLRQQSMNKRTPMIKLANSIILASSFD
ncbi:transcriptional regulator, CdaR [Chitinispirillum alkaliphilum]|nr:transcriptional regulator, CdaR [Chitinispirillum alkaliphilum]